MGVDKRFFLLVSHQPLLTTWLTFFTYSVLLALCLQLVVLPLLLPNFHAGNGLLLGGDWVGFHNIAVQYRQLILSDGWSVWTLSPKGHSPAGIASAIYTLTIPEPYVLVPINAALHATAGTTLMQIIRLIGVGDRTAFFASLSFVLPLSAMAWYAQIGKDGFYFAGAYLFLYGWITLARLSTWRFGWRAIFRGLILLFVGLILMGVVRIYSFQLMQGISIFFSIALTILFITRGAKGVLSWRRCVLAIVTLLLIPVFLKFAPIETRGTTEIPQHNIAPVFTWHGTVFARDKWRPTNFVPQFIDNSFLKIAVLRHGYLVTPGYDGSSSMVDRNIDLLRVKDFFSYFPRALQLGLFAPFPSELMGSDRAGVSRIMFNIAACEMLLVYVSLIFLPYTIWLFRTKVEMWLTISFGGIILLIYSYATPNIGSLYRLRYGFLMLLVALGLAGASIAWRKILKLNKNLITTFN